MRSSTIACTAAFAAVAIATPVAQGVTENIPPKGETAPEGCSPSFDGEFGIQVNNVTSTTSKFKRQQPEATELTITLKDGVLLDSQKRTGYIAANHQFQFDGPAQTGAIFTSGWSACSNGSLALGGSTIFHQCLSGDFFNLYDAETTSEQCNEVHINIKKKEDTSSASPSTTAAVEALSDGQPQAPTSQASVEVLPDGQPQAPTSQSTPEASPVKVLPDGQPQAPTSQSVPEASPVKVLPDGQPQAPTAQVAPYPSANSTAAAPQATGTGVIDSPAPFEGAASKIGAGVVSVAALFGLALAL